MECSECKYRKQIPLKRCKHFELGGDKKRKVRTLKKNFNLLFIDNLFLLLFFRDK